MTTYPNRGAQLLDERLSNLGIGRPEAAERIGVTRQTLHNLIKIGKPAAPQLIKLEDWLAIPARAWVEPPVPPPIPPERDVAQTDAGFAGGKSEPDFEGDTNPEAGNAA